MIYLRENLMNNVLKVSNLTKTYPNFKLVDVSFEIKPGSIMGFIGRNGSGKTTTLKSIMNLIHYDSGDITAFDKEMKDYELENKQRIGFSLSEIHYYPNKTIKQLSEVTSKFYRNFDMNKFKELCKFFGLDTSKKIEQLSSGMKVKYSLAIALCHNAELLILDEPTSGLDPVSRDEILDIFKQIVKSGDKAILFSTHITSDLDNCASDITYIHDGKIIYTGKKDSFINSYFYIKDNSKSADLEKYFVSFKINDNYHEGIISSSDVSHFENNDNIIIKTPDLEQIMVFLERKNNNESFTL